MISLDIKLPSGCEECPCSYWVQSGVFEGRLMCNAIEYKAITEKQSRVLYFVDDMKKDRPEKCPMVNLDGLEYTGRNGVKGVLYDLHKDPESGWRYQMSFTDVNTGREILHSYNAKPKTLAELKRAVDRMKGGV